MVTPAMDYLVIPVFQKCLHFASGLFQACEHKQRARARATTDGVQCICVGAVYRIPLSGPGMHSLAVRSTAWLWLIVLRWGFHPTPLLYYNKKGEKKNLASHPLPEPGYPNKQAIKTSCSCLFNWKRADCDVAWNLTESGIYLRRVLLSQRVTPRWLHMTTSTQWNKTY